MLAYMLVAHSEVLILCADGCSDLKERAFSCAAVAGMAARHRQNSSRQTTWLGFACHGPSILLPLLGQSANSILGYQALAPAARRQYRTFIFRIMITVPVHQQQYVTI